MVLTTTDEMTEAQRLQAEARQVYRANYFLGGKMTGAELGSKYKRSETWGYDRIREVLKELSSSPVAVSLPKGTELQGLPPMTTPPSLPQEPVAESAAPQEQVQAVVVETAEVTSEPQAPHEVPAVEPQRTAVLEARRAIRVWPVWLLMLPATVAIWSGWVGLGELAGFGPVRPLPGIVDSFEINSAITLPIGMEVYAGYALYVWLSGRAQGRALTMARTSAIAALITGALGQVAFHVMVAAGVGAAPWWITAGVACLPVAVLGMGAALAHMVRAEAEMIGAPAAPAA